MHKPVIQAQRLVHVYARPQFAQPKSSTRWIKDAEPICVKYTINCSFLSLQRTDRTVLSTVSTVQYSAIHQCRVVFPGNTRVVGIAAYRQSLSASLLLLCVGTPACPCRASAAMAPPPALYSTRSPTRSTTRVAAWATWGASPKVACTWTPESATHKQSRSTTRLGGYCCCCCSDDSPQLFLLLSARLLRFRLYLCHHLDRPHHHRCLNRSYVPGYARRGDGGHTRHATTAMVHDE